MSRSTFYNDVYVESLERVAMLSAELIKGQRNKYEITIEEMKKLVAEALEVSRFLYKHRHAVGEINDE